MIDSTRGVFGRPFSPAGRDLLLRDLSAGWFVHIVTCCIIQTTGSNEFVILRPYRKRIVAVAVLCVLFLKPSKNLFTKHAMQILVTGHVMFSL